MNAYIKREEGDWRALGRDAFIFIFQKFYINDNIDFL